MEANLPKMLNPAELIAWCKDRKKQLGISNARLAELSQVPIGTIDRILSGGYLEFRYSSIQPLIAVLLGFNKETPEPEDESSEQAQYYYNTIEGYKLVVENKNHELEELKRSIETQQREIAFLKTENNRKQELLEHTMAHTAWMEKLVDQLRDAPQKKRMPGPPKAEKL